MQSRGRGGGRGRDRGRAVAARQNHGIWWAKGGLGVIIEPHKHESEGISIAKGKESMLVSARHKNLVPGESVYSEKRISTDAGGEDDAEVEYRVWNPFRSKFGCWRIGWPWTRS